MGNDTTRDDDQTDLVAPDLHASGETLAAIDIGTNSVHGVVARMTAGEGGPRIEILLRAAGTRAGHPRGGDLRQRSA